MYVTSIVLHVSCCAKHLFLDGQICHGALLNLTLSTLFEFLFFQHLFNLFYIIMSFQISLSVRLERWDIYTRMVPCKEMCVLLCVLVVL